MIQMSRLNSRVQKASPLAGRLCSDEWPMFMTQIVQ